MPSKTFNYYTSNSSNCRPTNSAPSKKLDLLLCLAAVLALAVTVPVTIPAVVSDRGIFVSVGEDLLNGYRLYSEVYDNKEPLFYYFVAMQRSIPFGDFAAEVFLIVVCMISSYTLASNFASRRAAMGIAAVAVPLIVTGRFYDPGLTHLPGTSLTLAACAMCSRGRPATAGICIGLLLFTKIPIFPLALTAALGQTIAREAPGELSSFAAGLVVCVIAVLIAMLLRSELWPFLDVLEDNVLYSQGSLIEARTLAGSLKAHLDRVQGDRGGLYFFAVVIGIGIAQLTALAVYYHQAQRPRGMLTTLATNLLCLIMAGFILTITGMWPHHSQTLYIPAILALISLAPTFDHLEERRRRISVCLFLAAGLWLGGGPTFHRYLKNFAEISHALGSLREVSPETRRALMSNPPKTYARIGQNDDQGHAFGLSDWKLACPKFHQYYFESDAALNHVLDCASTAPTIIVAASVALKPGWPAWNNFVRRTEGILEASYSCDASYGLRICRRRTFPG
jgi:hypothetical protein